MQKWRRCWSAEQPQGGPHFEPNSALREAPRFGTQRTRLLSLYCNLTPPHPPHPTNHSQSRGPGPHLAIHTLGSGRLTNITASSMETVHYAHPLCLPKPPLSLQYLVHPHCVHSVHAGLPMVEDDCFPITLQCRCPTFCITRHHSDRALHSTHGLRP